MDQRRHNVNARIVEQDTFSLIGAYAPFGRIKKAQFRKYHYEKDFSMRHLKVTTYEALHKGYGLKEVNLKGKSIQDFSSTLILL